MRGKGFLGECASGRERGRGGSDDEMAAVHVVPPGAGFPGLLA
jgi:hypothetical protein